MTYKMFEETISKPKKTTIKNTNYCLIKKFIRKFYKDIVVVKRNRIQNLYLKRLIMFYFTGF